MVSTQKEKKIFSGGLWKNSRHPNLFFDLLSWFGFAIMGISNSYFSLIGFFGPLFLFAIMEFISTPITERVMQKRRNNEIFQEYKKKNKYFPF